MMTAGLRQVAWLVPALPLSAFFLIVFFGKKMPGKGAEIGITFTGATLLLGISCFAEAIAKHDVVERSLTWIRFGGLSLQLGMRVDALASMMFCVVGLVSVLMQIYSLGYMHGDVRYTWYYAAVNLFTGSMLVLVISNNILELLVGWELVGICSYLLIGHWYEEKENSSAAIKAFLTTRFGDLGFEIGVIFLFVTTHTFNIGRISQLVASHSVNETAITIGCLLLFCGAVGKSAQFPLHVWLPDAMAGPTPVSSLIHAATMVTAGVYMVARIYVLFAASHVALTVIGVIASITMLLAAVLACVQRDIKRVLAYSTVSQLGYMMAAMSVGAATAGVFHLWTHAFFKALLFLGSGSVIHAVHTNDMFEMGGLKRFMPVTYATFVIGSLALAGVPPFAGFWSKDEIVGAAWSSGNHLVFAAGIVTAFLTAFYMGRCLSLTFEGRYRRMPLAGAAADDHDGHGEHHLPHESPPSMTYPLIVLAFLSVVGGFVGTPFKNAFHEWIAIPGAEHGVVVPVMVVSIVLAVGGLAIGFRMYSRAPYGFGVIDPLSKLGPLYRAAVNRFYIDDLYVKGIVRPVQYGLSNFVYKVLDRKVIDGVVNGAAAGTALVGKLTRRNDERVIDGVVNGFGSITDKASYALRKIQSGNVQGYAAGLFAGVVILAAVLFLRGGI
jgi:NADH-quinone oxidoreductase subunit L